MGDDMHHPPPRRHFLRRAISVAGAAPLSSRPPPCPRPRRPAPFTASHPPRPGRLFLGRAISVAGAAPLSSRLGPAAGAGAALVATAANAANTPAAMPAPVGYQCFSADEAAFTETMVNVMCPADQFTPNGVDCGLAIFIDRQLSGAFGQGAGRYMSGPWREGKPELG